MADEVARDRDHVRIRGVGDRNRLVLNGHRRDPANVEVRQVGYPEMVELVYVPLRAGKAPHTKLACGVSPRIAAPKKPLPKLP